MKNRIFGPIIIVALMCTACGKKTEGNATNNNAINENVSQTTNAPTENEIDKQNLSSIEAQKSITTPVAPESEVKIHDAKTVEAVSAQTGNIIGKWVAVKADIPDIEVDYEFYDNGDLGMILFSDYDVVGKYSLEQDKLNMQIDITSDYSQVGYSYIKWIDNDHFNLCADVEGINILQSWARKGATTNSVVQANAETEKPAQQGLVVQRLANDQKREINIFLSNFWEVGYIAYDEKQLNQYDLINFTMWHYYKNTPNIFAAGDNGYLKLSTEHVDKALKRYLAIGINHASVKNPDGHSAADYNFDGKVYSFMPADGDMTTYFVNVKDMYYDSKTDTYTCNIDLDTYFNFENNAVLDGNQDPYHPDFLKNNSKDITIELSGTAVVKKVTEDGKTRYVLISMDVK